MNNIQSHSVSDPKPCPIVRPVLLLLRRWNLHPERYLHGYEVSEAPVCPQSPVSLHLYITCSVKFICNSRYIIYLFKYALHFYETFSSSIILSSSLFKKKNSLAFSGLADCVKKKKKSCLVSGRYVSRTCLGYVLTESHKNVIGNFAI